MRYSLFKYYRQQGLPTYEAGNHAWIDLIRYGTRSHLTDFWKSMPANFFVPWRFGTFTSLVKQATYHPVRTALLLGAVDYLREVNRRHRGKWIHLPWDYVEAPLAQLVQSKDGVDLLKNASSQAALTALFGPGGAFGASQLDSLLKTVQMHLHHAVNCLVGPAGKGFDASAGNPCGKAGAGAIPDSTDSAQKAKLQTIADSTKGRHYEWWVDDVRFPYQPRSYSAAAKPVDDGHGHAH